jgi:ribosomal protein S1
MEINLAAWEQVKRKMKIGDSISCIVTNHQPFGILVKVEEPPIWGVIERIGMSKQGFRTPDEYPPVGSIIFATLLGFREGSRQLELGLPRKITLSNDEI